MRAKNAYIPYGGYWSTPFCKWQGSYASQEPIPFAAQVARRALEEKKISPEVGRSIPVIMFNSVDLPQPEFPTIDMNWP